ncbi:asparagine synthetase domain-containing protein 1-like [Planococcus citri]|uniref:asparagine synthetase domain-containing protein 1-like n=1 Tax=Planococcus citri TaxID=170843 RepID=UPI0031F80462
MCGIACVLCCQNSPEKTSSTVDNIVKESLKRRGPDCSDERSISFDTWKGSFYGTVLHTQGSDLTPQPVYSSDSLLLWNGDVFDGSLITDNVRHQSDTSILIRWLENNSGDVLKMIKMIRGPYSFIYFDMKRRLLWISRDALGRHSLLWDVNDISLLICSVGHKDMNTLLEVPAAGVFCFEFGNDSITNILLYPWSHFDKISWDLPATVVISDTTLDYFDFTPKWIESKTYDFFNAECSENSSHTMDNLLDNPVILEQVSKLINLLTNSVQKRVTVRRNICRNCAPDQCSIDHAKVGVLFSGGIDSTILAYLADKFVPEEEPIDLMNVAFDQKGSFSVPDRKTGLLSLDEIRSLCPNRRWNFIEIDISRKELAEKQQTHITHLIHPLKTILDESLGSALWFASRGEGHIDNVPYTSSSKIILLGNGADEQLGGYTRHRNLLKRTGWNDLGIQLIKETIEISKRNLGRDDRIASDHGRQPRFPFLDENIVSFLADLVPWQKCNPVSFPPGTGDKLLLRLAAMKLGLRQCASFPKRAFQFGCRIANSKEKGDSCSKRL